MSLAFIVVNLRCYLAKEKRNANSGECRATSTTIFISVKLHFSILTGPWLASASLGGSVHQDLTKHFINKLIMWLGGEEIGEATTTTIFIFGKLHSNILTGPRIASASLGGPVIKI